MTRAKPRTRRPMPDIAEIYDALNGSPRFHNRNRGAFPLEIARRAVQDAFTTIPAYGRDWALKAALDDDRLVWVRRVHRYGWLEEAYLDDDGQRRFRQLGAGGDGTRGVTVYLDWSGDVLKESPADARQCDYIALRSTVDEWISQRRAKVESAQTASRVKEQEEQALFEQLHGDSYDMLMGLLVAAGVSKPHRLTKTFAMCIERRAETFTRAGVELELRNADLTAVANYLRSLGVAPAPRPAAPAEPVDADVLDEWELS